MIGLGGGAYSAELVCEPALVSLTSFTLLVILCWTSGLSSVSCVSPLLEG